MTTVYAVTWEDTDTIRVILENPANNDGQDRATAAGATLATNNNWTQDNPAALATVARSAQRRAVGTPDVVGVATRDDVAWDRLCCVGC